MILLTKWNGSSPCPNAERAVIVNPKPRLGCLNFAGGFFPPGVWSNFRHHQDWVASTLDLLFLLDRNNSSEGGVP